MVTMMENLNLPSGDIGGGNKVIFSLEVIEAELNYNEIC